MIKKENQMEKKKKYEVIRILIIAKFAISSPLHGKVIAWTEKKVTLKTPHPFIHHRPTSLLPHPNFGSTCQQTKLIAINLVHPNKSN